MACRLGEGSPSTPNKGEESPLTILETDSGMAKDMVMDNGNKGTSIATLHPYIKSYNLKKDKKTNSLKFSNLKFDDLYGPPKWTKYFEVKSERESDLEFFSYITRKIGDGVLFRRDEHGNRILEASNAAQSELLHNLIDTEDPEISIKRSETLNVCHGTILIPLSISLGNKEFTQCGNEIKDNIESQGIKVKTIETFVKPSTDKRTYPLQIAKVCFDTRVLPENVIVGGQRLRVKEYIPSPRQCNNCWKFGHPSKYCNQVTPTCPFCGQQNHKSDDCKEEICCLHCKGNHPAYAKSCIRYSREQMIIKVKFREGLSYNASKRKLQEEGLLPQILFSEIAKPSLTSTPINNSKVRPHSSISLSTSNRFSALSEDEEINNERPKAKAKRSMRNKRPREESIDDKNNANRTKSRTIGNLMREEMEASFHASSPNEGANIIFTVAEIHAENEEFHSFEMEETVVYDLHTVKETEPVAYDPYTTKVKETVLTREFNTEDVVSNPEDTEYNKITIVEIVNENQEIGKPDQIKLPSTVIVQDTKPPKDEKNNVKPHTGARTKTNVSFKKKAEKKEIPISPRTPYTNNTLKKDPGKKPVKLKSLIRDHATPTNISKK